MTFNKIFKLASKFELKLEKLAVNSPDQNSINQVIKNTFNSIKNNKILKEITGIAPQINVSNPIGEPLLVYFQVITDPKYYNSLIQEPYKSQITSFLKETIEQSLRNSFHGYDFKVKVGIVI